MLTIEYDSIEMKHFVSLKHVFFEGTWSNIILFPKRTAYNEWSVVMFEFLGEKDLENYQNSDSFRYTIRINIFNKNLNGT